MNKIGMLSALAVATAAGTAMAQPVLKFRTIFSDGTTSHTITSLLDNKVLIYVQARVDNWQQGLYQTTTGTVVNNAATYANTATARDQIGWSIAGLLIRSTENAVGGVNALPRLLNKGKLTSDQYRGDSDTRLTNDPGWQGTSETTHFGWTRFLRDGVSAQGEGTPGNGVPRVIAGKLAVVGSTTDNSVSVTDLNLTADLPTQGTNIGLTGTGTAANTGGFITLYVLQYDTTDFLVDDDGTLNGMREFDVTMQIASDAAGNRLAGLFFRNPNSGTNAGQLQNEMVMDLLASNTVHIRVLIPAPGAAALLGIGGLVATRRRRR